MGGDKGVDFGTSVTEESTVLSGATDSCTGANAVSFTFDGMSPGIFGSEASVAAGLLGSH